MPLTDSAVVTKPSPPYDIKKGVPSTPFFSL